MIHCTACGAILDASEQTVCPKCGRTLPLSDGPTLAVPGATAVTTPHQDDDPHGLVGETSNEYEILQFLGKGGMSAVYLVRHRGLDRLSALKVPLPHFLDCYRSDPDRFFSEARLAARLVHPRIVTIHNIGELYEQGLPFIEMEYVPGGSLAHRLRDARPVEALTAAEWMTHVAEGLAEAHRHDVLHRDIKPGNIFLTTTGKAKIGDFGLAWKCSPENSGLLSVGGTPAYMEPEIIRGEEPAPGTDVYAFGATFFAVLTGRVPYVARSVSELLDAHLYSPVPDPRTLAPSIPEPIALVIMQCLAKTRSERFANGLELYEACCRALGEARGIDQLLTEALGHMGVKVEPVETTNDRFRYRVTIALDRERRQTVYIDVSRSPLLSERVVRVYSFVCPAYPSAYERALTLNSAVPHARIGIEPRGTDLWFVASAVYPRATCDPEELRLSVLDVAQWADRLEEELTGADIE